MMLLEIKKKDEEDVQGNGFVINPKCTTSCGRKARVYIVVVTQPIGYLIIIINVSSDHLCLLLL